MSDKLTHFDAQGRPAMVDVGAKEPTARAAVASGAVRFSPESYRVIREGGGRKGDVAAVAELAGVMGAKKTAELIPLCHPLPLDKVTVRVVPDDAAHRYVVTAEAKTVARTGVEMEAMTAVMTACLTLYDMAKAIDKSITIDDVKLISKSGGRSGDFKREK